MSAVQPAAERMPWSLVLAGAAAVIVGLGFARFGFAPLIPGMVDAGWFGADQTAHLGAANLTGYLFGAVTASALANRFGIGSTIRLSLLIVSLGFLLCSLPGPFLWFFVWRFLAGWAGAVLMVVAPSTALALTPVRHRPMAAAWIFGGIGVGILAAALLMPPVLRLGTGWGWALLGFSSLLLTAWSWQRWSTSRIRSAATAAGAANAAATPFVVWLVIAAYSVSAAGFVPHTLFWVDFVARERNYGLDLGSLQWALFAAGAIIGPFVAGFLAKRSGWFLALLLVAFCKAVIVALSAAPLGLLLISLCSLLAGALAPAMVSLTSGYVTSLVDTAVHRRAWGWATAAFAVSQAIAAQGMALVYAVVGSYVPLFLLGGVSLLCGALLVLSTRVVAGGDSGN
ncbi:MFS transporter [Methylonatrum kenyense]|uniref:YbfB/YjiJ family MFS transporter n=1 Tax=Methylonatrum kenyense TaxID=455253 RepID=UPI0020BF3AAE|nr:YbfB/YjiJ family MFS transporter [Methylonatrum kenyense]MCK8516217.1 MFS transporter [Methylonatrum kenyense]